MALLRLDQALGRIEEVISPRLPVPALSVERHLAEPIGLVEDIERLILLLAGSLKRDLERRGEGARRFELLLFRVDGAVSRISAAASLPLREPAPVGRLFHERLAALGAALDPGYGFDLVRLSAFAVAPVEIRQADLGGEAGRSDEDVALFADRVRARLGSAAMLQPQLAESHLPERASRLVPFSAAEPSPANAPDRPPERPLRLFSRPEPIEVPLTEVPEGPPLKFRWRRGLHSVARAEGPERIAPEWWREEKEAPTRDYFRVEDAEGHRYWLFREGLYEAEGPAPRWYMQGISA
jgi:protein ImuB